MDSKTAEGKTVENTPAFVLKTVRMRRSRPTPLAMAVALMLTMLFVYLVSLSGQRAEVQAASANAQMQQEVHMDGLTARFSVFVRTPDAFAARAEAANCAQAGGAGWILHDGGEYAVIYGVASAAEAAENGENMLVRTSGGFTMKLNGRGKQVAAAAEAMEFLRAMAAETGALAPNIENGGDTSSVSALMGVYKTRAERIAAGLEGAQSAAAVLIRDALSRTVDRIDCALADMDASKIRLIHTAANAEWISLTEEMKTIKAFC